MNKILSICKERFFELFTFTLLVLAFFGALGLNSARTFDKCSNDVILSDLIYNQNYDDFPPFIQIYGACGIDDYYTPFYEREKISKDAFHSYTSSVVIHGKVYRLLNKVFPFSPQINLKILYIINILMLSFFLTYIIKWLKKITNTVAAFVLTIVAAFFSPNLLSLGQNLYWIGWTMFIPLAGMIFYTESNYIKAKKNNLFAFIIAFICCLFKILCYFEFVTTVMISMMIPFIYYYIINRQSIKTILIKSLYPTAGALLSFIVVCFYKFYLLFIDLNSISMAKDRFIAPIIYRIVGSKNDPNEIINIAGSARIADVVNVFLNETAFILFKSLNISFRDILIISIIAMFGAGILLKKNTLKVEVKVKIKALWICTILSFFASVSWYVFGKPHAYIHKTQCLTNWYIPFVLFATVFSVWILLLSVTKKNTYI